jgi:Zn-dependent M28 family amino/carboxypeptidase
VRSARSLPLRPIALLGAVLPVALCARPAQSQPRASAPAAPSAAVGAPAFEDARIHAIATGASAARIEADIRTLVSFGTRHTLSDTLSQTRGIGAARRWIHAEFTRISQACGGCLEVRYVADVVKGDPNGRIKQDVNVVNVVAIQRGRTDPNRYVLLSGDIDSRVTDVLDATSESPGANDNASGIAATLEAARLLTKHRPDASIVYADLSSEEQGLQGGDILARVAKQENWRLEAVINNDMIGNTQGGNGVTENTTARVFAPACRRRPRPRSCAASSPTAGSSTRRRVSWRATSTAWPTSTSRT